MSCIAVVGEADRGRHPPIAIGEVTAAAAQYLFAHQVATMPLPAQQVGLAADGGDVAVDGCEPHVIIRHPARVAVVEEVDAYQRGAGRGGDTAIVQLLLHGWKTKPKEGGHSQRSVQLEVIATLNRTDCWSHSWKRSAHQSVFLPIVLQFSSAFRLYLTWPLTVSSATK